MTRTWIATGVVLAFAAAFDIAFPYADHPESWWHTTPAFDLLYGFVGCIATVYFSKWLGRWVSRPEDYYQRDET